MFTSLKLKLTMPSHIALSLTLLALVACAGGMFVSKEGARAAATRPAATNKPALSAVNAKLPLSFEPNRGQADSAVKFLARGNGYRLSLTADGAAIALHGNGSKPEHSSAAVLRMKLVNASQTSRVEPLDELPGKSNYLIGNDPQQWRTAVANYANVKYHTVYPGIDLLYYGQEGQLEYDFILQPGADPKRIKLAFAGAAEMRLEANGDLMLCTDGGEVRQHQPGVYQTIDGGKRLIAGRYVQTNEREVGFEIGEYDTSQPLVIDPVLSYASYLGGSGSDQGWAIALDPNGNIYVAGTTNSANFMTANPLQPTLGGGSDSFIAKFNPSGTALIYSTYLGGSGTETPIGMTVDSAGNVYLIGITNSLNFPLGAALQAGYGGGAADAFLVKLNASGASFAYSTYLGGSGLDQGNAVTVDASGAVYLIGDTASTNFPRINSLQPNFGGGPIDVFVAKIQADGSALVFSTYFGGNSADAGSGIAVDSTGNIYLAGITGSTNFPVASPLQSNLGGGLDVYVSKLSATGRMLIYSTYLGGSGDDLFGTPGNSIAVDATGNVYLTGLTASPNFPTANPLQATFGGGSSDAFVTKINANGSAFVYSTYLGGSGNENLTSSNLPLQSIALDAAGQIYVTGTTSSTNFPTANAVQVALGGDYDAFVAKLNVSGSALVYSTYFGGSNREDGLGIAVDSIGNAYVTGRTLSTNLQTVNPLQAAYGGGPFDAFIVKLGADAVTVSAASFSGAAIASKAIVAAFGPNLATATASASSQPLPTTLAGTTVRIRDSAGTERAAPLFFVSANQINYQIPDGTVAGPAAVTITSGDGRISSAVIRVVPAAPSIFTTNASGTGAAAALDAITFTGAPFNATQTNGQPNIIAVFGTGLGADATDVDGDVSANVQAAIDGNAVTVLYAGRVPGLVGLNQFNVRLPGGITAGTHTLVIARNGVPSNIVTLAVR